MALVVLPRTVAGTVDFIEKLVQGAHWATDDEIMDMIETQLKGGPEGRFAGAIAAFMSHRDRAGAWQRFIRSTVRYFGENWRETLVSVSPTKMDAPHMLACSTEGCMELAWGRICDQCLVKQLS